LITAGDIIQLWKYEDDFSTNLPCHSPLVTPDLSPEVQFTLGINEDESTSHMHNQWTCVWSTQPPSSVHSIAFSSDGQLFAASAQVSIN
jgi:hypothetical protein